MQFAQALKFNPLLVEKPWGGDRLHRVLGRPESSRPVGESWDLVDRPEFSSKVAEGPLAGRRLHKLIEEAGTALIGPQTASTQFPLLFKYIDASGRLSVQVHPDTAWARKHGTQPKHECWYVLEADADAYVYLGLNRACERNEFREAVEAGKVETLLRKLPVRKGDFFHVPAGTVHSIGGGVLFAEMQQNSDSTYRIYDWNRNAGVESRPLHLEQALEAMSFQPMPAPVERDAADVPGKVRLAECEAFVVDKVVLNAAQAQTRESDFCSVWQIVDGAGTCAWAGGEISLARGETFLAPADLDAYTLAPESTMTLLKTTPRAATGTPK